MNALSAHRARRFLAAVLLVGLTACSRKDTASAPNTVLVWHWMTDREDALQVLADQYEKATGVKVKLELYGPSDSYATKVRAAAQTNTLPDVFSVLGGIARSRQLH